MINLKDVFKGFYRLVVRTPQTEKLAQYRRSECDICKYKTKVRTCSVCKCFLPAKQRCLSSTNDCPFRKWGENDDIVAVYRGEIEALNAKDSLINIVKIKREYSDFYFGFPYRSDFLECALSNLFNDLYYYGRAYSEIKDEILRTVLSSNGHSDKRRVNEVYMKVYKSLEDLRLSYYKEIFEDEQICRKREERKRAIF